MRILHTSDWHLGNRLHQNDRDDEFSLMLDWMIDTINQEQIDVLVIAGDVFDLANPSNSARKLYYSFLHRLAATNVRHTVITGGNHDSPSMLDAPADLLSAFNIHVVAAATGNLEDEIIILNDAQGSPELIVAAVPFLRERDLRVGITMDGNYDRLKVLRAQIARHYASIGAAVEALALPQVPVIGTGHLCVSGSTDSKEKSYIFIGDHENITTSQFPECFDYVALGHIHRPQAVGKIATIRYSGSPLPMSFSEARDEKSVVVFEFDGRSVTKLRTIALPVWRRLKALQGNVATVLEELTAFAERRDEPLPAWLEIKVEDAEKGHQINHDLRSHAAELGMSVLAVRLKRTVSARQTDDRQEELEALADEAVFKLKMETAGYPLEEQSTLLTAYRELKNWREEQ